MNWTHKDPPGVVPAPEVAAWFVTGVKGWYIFGTFLWYIHEIRTKDNVLNQN